MSITSNVNNVAAILDLYNEKLNFFDLISPNGLDDLMYRTTENVSLETFGTLDKARISYTSLSGEILQWCTALNNSLVLEGEVPDSNPDDQFLTLHVTKELEKMKEYYDSIPTNSTLAKNVEDISVYISIKGEILTMNVTHGNITDNVEELLRTYIPKLKAQDNITKNIVTTTFSGELSYAKRIINESLSMIAAGNPYKLSKTVLMEKCKPILANSTAAHLQRNGNRLILSSEKDSLVLNKTEGAPDACEAILSIPTVTQLKKLYRDEQYIASFFDSINKSNLQECKSYMTSFVKSSFISWGYLILKDSQSMKISIQLSKPDSTPQVTVVN
ncbi:uncharacterized protein LOC108594893 [Drosophila busckii]|uniref:uncharacterized protein LOC108594893 n=1 Tax=Drosophila busckii TaxID=30019 RepID=UPI00083EE954|nr:uncharacterized protein LOC108594893 [Drosophila busckii]